MKKVLFIFCFLLFTNDLYISNLWLQKKNSNLLISDGFTNSLKNSQIEFNLFNSPLAKLTVI